MKRVGYVLRGLILVFVECLIRSKDLYELLYIDSLTGVLNFRATSEEGRRAVDSAKRRGEWISIVMIDLDGFKDINDCGGHELGDEVLVDFAGSLKKVLRASDLTGKPGRKGGDEFVLILSQADYEGALKALKRIERANEVVAFSYGICSLQLSRDDRTTFEDMLVKADAAMYAQKEAKGTAR